MDGAMTASLQPGVAPEVTSAARPGAGAARGVGIPLRTLFSILRGAPLLLALAGCGAAMSDLQAMSTGYVGCPPEEIAISRESVGLGTWTWAAACRGRTYHCALQGQVAAAVPAEARFTQEIRGSLTPNGTRYVQPETAPVARCAMEPASPPPSSPPGPRGEQARFSASPAEAPPR
jgi:hypothetical protein